MKHGLCKKKGFTLVELIVVVMIVGILAAVAVPMMTANVNKAKKSEAMAGLGAYRTAFRLYMVENSGVVPTTKALMGSYIKSTDVDGRYFKSGDYQEPTAANLMVVTNGTLTCNMDLFTGVIGNY